MACEQVRRTISDADGRALRGRRMRAHLRDCAGCAVFAAAIPARSADLRAIAPGLPAVAAAGLFARAMGGGSGHGAGGLAAGAAGKTVSAALAAKALAGVAIVATATVGVTGVLRHKVHTSRHPPASRSAPTRPPSAAIHGVNLKSPALPRSTRGRRAAHNGAVGVGAASAIASTVARSAGQAPALTRGSGARGSGVASSGAGARGLASAHAHSTPRGVPQIPTGRPGSRGAQHRGGAPASVPAAGRPSTPRVGQPTAPGSSSPGTAAGNAPGTSAAPAAPSPPAR
jgi:hypothetical protein